MDGKSSPVGLGSFCPNGAAKAGDRADRSFILPYQPCCAVRKGHAEPDIDATPGRGLLCRPLVPRSASQPQWTPQAPSSDTRAPVSANRNLQHEDMDGMSTNPDTPLACCPRSEPMTTAGCRVWSSAGRRAPLGEQNSKPPIGGTLIVLPG